MAYQSLYRRYRPRRFADLVGQEHVVGALRNAVRDGRTGHAYLFSGPRGTGKTSTARILAKALNCTALADGEPCGRCESCEAIDSGSSYDLFELDAASNNKVEDVRDLISRVAIGSPGRTKVYILDEVHMLSAAASNALLKTLEEPPEHVTFVLATTDPQKVLPTIRSRTQHFEFGLIPAAELEQHLHWVVSDAGLDLDEASLAWVVRKGAGSARDALSALDQVAAAGGVGAAAAPLDELMEALCDRDPARALVGVASALAAGREPRLVAEDLLGRLREAFLAAVAPDLSQLPDQERERAADAARRLGPAALTRGLEVVGEAILEMRQAPDARIPLEVGLIRLTRAELDPSPSALVERVARLEAALSAGLAAAPSNTLPVEVNAADAGAPSAPPAPPRGQGATSRPPATASATPTPTAREGAAAAARRRLAQTRAEAAPAGAARPGPAAGRVPAGAPESGSPPPPEREHSPIPSGGTATPDAAADAVGAESPSSAGPTVAELEAAWGEWVLDHLPPGLRALYRAGRFVGVEGGAAIFALPSKVHRDRCEARRAEVESRLTERLGRPVPLRLVVDEGGGGGRSGSGPADRSLPEPEPGPEDLDDVGDVADLPEATDVAPAGLQRLMEAFPGAEVVE